MTQPRNQTAPVFHADDNTYVDVPGIPQVPEFPVRTGVQWHQHYMETMSDQTREAFVFYYYHSGDPLDHHYAGAHFHLLHATDLFDHAYDAIPHDPRLYSFNMMLAETAITAGQFMLHSARMTDPQAGLYAF